MSQMSRILVVEDEQHLAEGLRFNLEAEGYQVRGRGDRRSRAGIADARSPAAFDVVVLDVMLPGKDGFTVMSELRQAGQFVPTLMLTARGHPEDVLKGFAAGRGRLSHQAVRARHPDRAHPRPAAPAASGCAMRLRRRQSEATPAAAARTRPFTFGDKSVDFDLLELRVRDQVFPLTADGGRTSCAI